MKASLDARSPFITYCPEHAPAAPPVPDYEEAGRRKGALVASKQKQYGDSVGKSGRILALLYPAGVPPHAYDDALLIVRVLDKLSRIAQRGADGADLGGESPWSDICGYGLLGSVKDEAKDKK